MSTGRRRILAAAAGGTVAAASFARKPLAAGLNLPEPGQRARPAPPGKEVPDLVLRLPDGTERSLRGYLGQGVVLNLWATWCAPCVAEMPSLDALAAAVAPSGVVVLPLSTDRGGAAVVQRFYEARGIRNLPVLLDPSSLSTRALGLAGLPTTLLIDKAGQERARVEGGAAWDTPAAIAMVKALAG